MTGSVRNARLHLIASGVLKDRINYSRYWTIGAAG